MTPEDDKRIAESVRYNRAEQDAYDAGYRQAQKDLEPPPAKGNAETAREIVRTGTYHHSEVGLVAYATLEFKITAALDAKDAANAQRARVPREECRAWRTWSKTITLDTMHYRAEQLCQARDATDATPGALSDEHRDYMPSSNATRFVAAAIEHFPALIAAARRAERLEKAMTKIDAITGAGESNASASLLAHAKAIARAALAGKGEE